MSTERSDISSRTKRLITSVLGLFVLVHVWVLVTQTQHWPVLSYPMFASNMEDGLHCPVVFAVPADGKPEFRLTPRHTGVPFMASQYAFGKMLRYPHRTPAYESATNDCLGQTGDALTTCAGEVIARRALAFLFSRYEIKRARQKLPALRGLRVYDVTYSPSPSPRVWDVTSKQLRAEWMTGSGSP